MSGSPRGWNDGVAAADLEAARAAVRPMVERLRLEERIGVRALFGARSEYKTARNTLTRREFTAEHREQVERLVEGVYRQLVAAAAQRTAESAAVMRGKLARGPFLAADARKSLRIVDGHERYDALRDARIARLLGLREGRSPTLYALREYGAREREARRGRARRFHPAAVAHRPDGRFRAHLGDR